MSDQLEAVSADDLVTATGGDFKGATFGALALLNASGIVTQPSNSIPRLMQGPPPVVQQLTQPQQPRPAFIGPAKP